MERLSALWRAYLPCGEPIPPVESLFPLWRACRPVRLPSLTVHHAALVAEGRGFDSPCPAILPPPPPQVQFLVVFFVGGVAHFETYGFFVGGVAHFETYGPPHPP